MSNLMGTVEPLWLVLQRYEHLWNPQYSAENFLHLHNDAVRRNFLTHSLESLAPPVMLSGMLLLYHSPYFSYCSDKWVGFSVSIRTFSKGLLTSAADLRASRHSDLSQLAQATVIDSISMNFYIVKPVSRLQMFNFERSKFLPKYCDIEDFQIFDEDQFKVTYMENHITYMKFY